MDVARDMAMVARERGAGSRQAGTADTGHRALSKLSPAAGQRLKITTHCEAE